MLGELTTLHLAVVAFAFLGLTAIAWRVRRKAVKKSSGGGSKPNRLK